MGVLVVTVELLGPLNACVTVSAWHGLGLALEELSRDRFRAALNESARGHGRDRGAKDGRGQQEKVEELHIWLLWGGCV